MTSGATGIDVVLMTLALVGSGVALAAGIHLIAWYAHQPAYPRFANGISSTRREFGITYGAIGACVGPALMAVVWLAIRHASLSRRRMLFVVGLVGAVVSGAAATMLLASWLSL